jgi:acyl-CoA reductase-like NAD-dependent aldehyde dehydrogenase
LWIDAGAPAGLYTNIFISHEQSDHVIDDPRIKGVALTGSVAAGRSVAARAGKILALANDSDFGLGGSVFTKDVARGKRVASRVDTGMMFINNIDWSDAELPFGGVKNSGYGRELGDMGIQEFVNKKLVRTAVMDAPV